VIRTVSTDIRKDLLRWGFDSRRVFYATPPVESEGFLGEDGDREEEIIRRFQLDRWQTFIYVGRLSKEKNLPMILSSIRKVAKNEPWVKLLIVGKGPEEGRLRSLADLWALGDRVIFVGAVPHDEIRNYLRASCALVIASLYEGTAKVIKEAAIAGRTAISTKTSGVDDAMVQGKTGLVIPIGDEDALCEAMEFLLKNTHEARNMGEKARAFVLGKFDYEKDVDRIIDVWQQALRTP
jgi:glycosyltransferase involved in cell wall biosynthesis